MNWASLPKKEEKKRRTRIYIIGKRGKTWMTEFPPKEHRHATACSLLHSSTAGSKQVPEECVSFITHPLFLT